jgi:antirestriction protein ArdC
MPRPESFESAEAYYRVLYHELIHSTGHSSRLDRKLDSPLLPFGSAAYSEEELVAEFGAAFLCGIAGIDGSQIDQSAAYIEGWLKRLRDDSLLVVFAAAQAQKAADYVVSGGADAATDQE